jgi:hypothetical protein
MSGPSGVFVPVLIPIKESDPEMISNAIKRYNDLQEALATGDKIAVLHRLRTFSNRFSAFVEATAQADYPDSEFYRVVQDFGRHLHLDGLQLTQYCQSWIERNP